MSVSPFKPDPADPVQVEWLKRRREEMDRANAAWPEILNELRAAGGLRPMKKSAFKGLDPDREYAPGFEEDWTIS